MVKKNCTDTTSGFVYLIQADDKLYKLGRTKNPQKRLKQLQTGSSKKLKLVCYLAVKDMKKAEKFLHAIFNSGRKHGEWFQFTDKDMILIRKIFNQAKLTPIEHKKLERMGLR